MSFEAAKAAAEELQWYVYEADAQTIDALRKGKGSKGGKRGRGGKNGSKGPSLLGGAPPGAGGPRKGEGKGIKGSCWNCGEQGHMAANCPKPGGGKNGRVNEVLADQAEQSTANTEEAAAAAAASEAWFGTAPAWSLLGCLSPDHQAQEEKTSNNELKEHSSTCSGSPRCRFGSHRAPPRGQERESWKPSLARLGCHPQQSMLPAGVATETPTQNMNEDIGLWPLPCSVAANPIRQSLAEVVPGAPTATTPTTTRRRRNWKLLQGVWEDTREESDQNKPNHEDDDGSQPAALCGLTVPARIPDGMRVVRVDATVDSGAEAVVAPKGIIPGGLSPSEMSRSGKMYRAANGSKIANFGQTKADFRTGEGHHCQLLFQVADVERVLIGVTPLTESGHMVKLGKDGGEIMHVATGRRIALQRRGGVYHLPMFFLVPNEGPAAHAQDFQRQGP